MISLFRNFARSKWAVGLLAIVALSLLITGGSQMDVLGALQPPRVISAGDRSLDAREFQLAVEQVRNNIQREQGQAPTTEEMANDPGFVGAFQQRAQQLALLAWAHTVGVRPGAELILREIRQQPAFFDPVSRKFDEQAYRARLAEAQLTPAMVEEQYRDEYALLHYGTAIAAGSRLPRVYGAVIANQTQQRRDGRWFTVTQAMAGTAPAPTDAQLTTFMQQNAAQLRRPELRRASVIVFDNPADAQAPITDAQIQERFEFRRPALAVAERRTFTTITAPSQAVADRVAAALRAGQTPAAVASANQLQPAIYTDTPRTAVGDPAIAAAVFGTAAGQVSNPVRAGVGFVVAQVDSISAGRDVTLADVRPQIVEELQESAARAKALERVNAYEAARRKGQSADDAVRAVGARTIALPPLTREGRAPNGQQVNIPPALLENIWRLPRGGVSEIAQLADNQVYAVRVDEVTPAAMPELGAIRPQLAQAWTQRENARLLSARAEVLAARLLAEGIAPSRVARMLTDLLGLPHKEAYRLALDENRKPSGQEPTTKNQ